jgi:hypothetical protein
MRKDFSRGDGGSEPAPERTLPSSEIFDADGALSREFLLQRGFCCGLGCKNCPYGDESHANKGDA